MFFIMLFSKVFCTENKIRISKIKIFLDDIEITSEQNDKTGIKFSTILSFTKLRINKEISQKAFEKEIKQTKLRLIDSGLFYSAEVETLPSKKNPGTIVVYINVRKGFLFRFGGGSIYGLFGKASLAGNRDKILGYVGYNKNGISYLNENCFGIPIIIGGGVFSNFPEGLIEQSGIKIEGLLKNGVFITPDLRVGNDTGGSCLFNKKSESSVITDIYFSPYLYGTFYSEKAFSTLELRSFNYFYDFYGRCEKFNSIEGAFTIDYSPVSKLTFAGMFSAGIVCYSDNQKISLEKNALTVCDGPGLSNRGIRSGYLLEELQADCYGLFSTEVRFNVLSLKIPPAFPFNIVPFVFTDLALSHNWHSEHVDFLDAYGIGLQLEFESPVFAYFNFSYGVNHMGKGRFIFAAMQSF